MDEPKPTNVTWNEIVIPQVPDRKCSHYFEFIDGECRCKHCKMGLLGVVNIVDGRPQ